MVDLHIDNNWINAALLIGALLLIGHWLPWANLTGSKLGRIASYTYGSSVLLIGAAVWLDSFGLAHLAIGLLLLYMVGGLAVVAAYGLDSLGMRLARRRRINNAATDRR